ncbi:MAG TPA: glycosyltransferase [Mycobacteriales bacterium]
MISWIVASHDPTILLRNLAASMVDVGSDQVIVVENAPSIAVAYNEGQAKADFPVRCYVHHDVQILNLPRLRAELVEHATDAVGMVGVVGSRTVALPWWSGVCLGSVVDGRHGVLGFGEGGPCAILDGLLLATAQHVEWDETIPGWHGYDADACLQMAARGLPNECVGGGHELVAHNTNNSRDPDELNGFHDAMARVKQKWGTDGAGR